MKPLIIGKNTFKYKKDALSFYKSILNSYNFGKSLNDEDFNSVIDLLLFDDDTEKEEQILDIDQQLDLFFETNKIDNYKEKLNEIDETSQDLEIVDIKVSKVQFNTKCFEVFFNDMSSQYISYILLINKPNHNPHGIFSAACRNIIQRDLVNVKQKYFKTHAVNGHVKCQETGQLSNWEDLVIDHRQPNTFSVIVDRFKEVFNIDIDMVDYDTNELNIMVFKDPALIKNFQNYHKEKANLRIVKKENNLCRTGMARIKRTSKDLTIQ